MGMDRRQFLKYAGTSLLLISGMPLVGCKGVRRMDLSKYNGREKSIKGLDNDDMDILYLASLAPNGHNAQAWTVKVVKPKHWIIGADKSRWLTATDPENHNFFLSIGAFIENLVIAAGTYGYEADVRIVAKNPMDTKIASVRLMKSKHENYPLERIKKRRMLKLPYQKKEINPADIKYLTNHAPEQISYFSKGSPQSELIEDGTYECNRIQVYRKDYRKELANWLRWSDNDAREHRDGLTAESMSISGILGWYVRHFFDRQSALEDSFHERYLGIVEDLLNNHGGWIVFTCKDGSVPSLIETGRCFERLWLKARDKMIAVQPFSQMLEEAPGSITGLRDGAGEVHFIMRVGYIDSYPDPVSLRRPVSWFVS